MARFRHSWADYDGPPSDSPAYGLTKAWEVPDPADPPGRLPDQVAAARDALLAGTSPIDIRSQLSATFKEQAQPRKAIQKRHSSDRS